MVHAAHVVAWETKTTQTKTTNQTNKHIKSAFLKWREQKKRAYFNLGNLLSEKRLPLQMRYAQFFVSAILQVQTDLSWMHCVTSDDHSITIYQKSWVLDTLYHILHGIFAYYIHYDLLSLSPFFPRKTTFWRQEDTYASRVSDLFEDAVNFCLEYTSIL